MDVDTTIHPHPIPNTHHRKIELQSHQDLIYLQTNLIATARQKLDLNFPPLAAQQKQRKAQPATVISLDGVHPAVLKAQDEANKQQEPSSDSGIEEEDPMRATVRAHVDAFMSRVYSYASNSITVNGLDATSLPPSILTTKSPTPISPSDTAGSLSEREEKEGIHFSYEAHDTRLQKRVADLYGDLEYLTVQVGQLRRMAPEQGAKMMQELFTETAEKEDAEFESEFNTMKEEGAVEASQTHDSGALKLKPLPDGWFEDHKAMYERGTNELAALAGLTRRVEGEDASAAYGPSLTETVGKAQRARTVTMEFE